MYCKYDEPDMIAEAFKAVAEERIEDLRFFLTDGMDPDQRDRNGRPLLVSAVAAGKLQSAEVLLAFGADPNIEIAMTRHTPLHYAMDGEPGPMIGLLVQHGARLAAVDAYGWTPLHMAADRGRIGAVKALIAAGADARAKSRDGETPRDRAEAHFRQLGQANHKLCREYLYAAEQGFDFGDLEHDKAERDITILKAHNPKRFRVKF